MRFYLRTPVLFVAANAAGVLGHCAYAGTPRPGGNLIVNGDFEAEPEQRPPVGWTMWGSRKYKDPVNYTRDTKSPASGKACLRMHHPADTNGYIVSSPQYAIRSEMGTTYTISFRARTDRPGMSVAYLEGYESLKPYKDAPSPGRFPFRAGREWAAYEFAVQEGVDFLSRESKYMLLAFRVTMNKSEKKTLWIDEVAVTAAKGAAGSALIGVDFRDEADLRVEPLRHRLRPGRSFAIEVDARIVLREATRRACGVSFHRVAGWTRSPYDREGRWNLDRRLEHAVREMRLPMTRFYGVGAEPFPVEDAIDKAAAVCRKTRIPLEHVVLELETQSAAARLPADRWAEAARHAADKGYGFRYWEVANEPYTRKATAFASPLSYVEHLKRVSAAVKRVEPDAQIGVAVNPASLSWGNSVLKEGAGHYDFVVGHHYCSVPDVEKRSLADVALAANYRKLAEILRLNALIRAYNPGRDVYQYDTEWGLSCAGPNGEPPEAYARNANIYGALHRAVRLIYYVREDIVRGAGSWEMFSRTKTPGFGVLTPDAPDRAFLIYWLYYLFNRHVGEHVVQLGGAVPFNTSGGDAAGPLTPVLATKSGDGGRLFVVVVNGTWERSIRGSCKLLGFTPRAVSAVCLSHDDDDKDANPLVERREDVVRTLPVTLDGATLAFTLPPRCVAFITIRARP